MHFRFVFVRLLYSFSRIKRDIDSWPLLNVSCLDSLRVAITWCMTHRRRRTRVSSFTTSGKRWWRWATCQPWPYLGKCTMSNRRTWGPRLAANLIVYRSTKVLGEKRDFVYWNGGVVTVIENFKWLNGLSNLCKNVQSSTPSLDLRLRGCFFI